MKEKRFKLNISKGLQFLFFITPAKELPSKGLVRGGIRVFVQSEYQASKTFTVSSIEGLVPSRYEKSDCEERYTFRGHSKLDRYSTVEDAVDDINNKLELKVKELNILEFI
jgi:hypothetical protein